MTFFLSNPSAVAVYLTHYARTTSPLPLGTAVGGRAAANLSLLHIGAYNGGYMYSAAFGSRFAFLRLPDTLANTTVPIPSGQTYRGLFSIATHVGKAISPLYAIDAPVSVHHPHHHHHHPPGLRNCGCGIPPNLGMAFNELVLRNNFVQWSPDATTPGSNRHAPSNVPMIGGRFYVYTPSPNDNSKITVRVDLGPIGTTTSNLRELAIGETDDSGIVWKDIGGTTPATFSTEVNTFVAGHGSVLPTTSESSFVYYITAPHATVNASLSTLIDYKQVAFDTTSGTISAASGYNYATQGWVFEAQTDPNTYKIRLAGSTTAYLEVNTEDANVDSFVIEPHKVQFGAFTIKLAVSGSIGTYLSCNPAGVLSWAKSPNANSTNFGFYFRPGETSFPEIWV